MSDADSPSATLRPMCCCFIVPPSVLKKYSRDPAMDDATRKTMQDTYVETERLRGLREAHRVATIRDPDRFAAAVAAPRVPAQHLFDCVHKKTLPGKPAPTPLTGGFKIVFDTTAGVADFYKKVLGRNSVDNKGADLNSSLHYDKKYDNAFWNGSQMVYGDGDGKMFVEMYLSPDVIGHELTHGVTQNLSALRYEGESGALNESISDVFGATFNQWTNKWKVTDARGWLIGAGIMGAQSKAKHFTCLRDMVDPGAVHCLSPQPDDYSKIDPTADVHENSGVPNKAYALFARAIGGSSWTTAIKVWYDTCADRSLRSDATFSEFATMTVASAEKIGHAALAKKCEAAWAAVGVATGA
ncbi:M4 family metallopeptidase [Variovorax sp. J22R133]|uniref:M4 family metallopeptidase n=1 Tax=Variovorax brevis TaxID=3053503 RepID=UPI002575711E|nr:M4 family metallopeptidase [Variovorax sp. J22R133]MDM0112656.1 M4 family metallopeptidase [Variovorax sp. J22R133]